MKRIISILAVLMLALCLASCDGKAKGTSSTVSEKEISSDVGNAPSGNTDGEYDNNSSGGFMSDVESGADSVVSSGKEIISSIAG